MRRENAWMVAVTKTKTLEAGGGRSSNNNKHNTHTGVRLNFERAKRNVERRRLAFNRGGVLGERAGARAREKAGAKAGTRGGERRESLGALSHATVYCLSLLDDFICSFRHQKQRKHAGC